MSKFIVLFIFSICFTCKAQFDTTISKKEYEIARKTLKRSFKDSVYNRGKIFERHNIYFATEGSFSFFVAKHYSPKPDFRLTWKPTFGYFPVKRLLIAIHPTYIRHSTKFYKNDSWQIGSFARYYFGRYRVTGFGEAGYYFGNTYNGPVFAYEPKAKNEFTYIKQYAFVGAGLNIRVWNNISFSWSARAFFLLKKVTDNDNWNLDQNWGISYIFPTMRYKRDKRIFDQPKF